MAVPAQNFMASDSSLALRGTPGSEPRSRRGGGGGEQQPEHLASTANAPPQVRPTDCRPRPALAHLNRTIRPASLRRPSWTQKGLRGPKADEAHSPQKLGHLPASLITSRLRPKRRTAARAGSFAPQRYLTKRTGKPGAPGLWSSGPGGIPGEGSSGKRERG